MAVAIEEILCEHSALGRGRPYLLPSASQGTLWRPITYALALLKLLNNRTAGREKTSERIDKRIHTKTECFKAKNTRSDLKKSGSSGSEKRKRAVVTTLPPATTLVKRMKSKRLASPLPSSICEPSPRSGGGFPRRPGVDVASFVIAF